MVPHKEYPNLPGVVVTQAYDKLIDDMSKTYLDKYTKSKEQDMCKDTKRWSVVIEPGYNSTGSNEGYYVKVYHKDKGRTDEVTRNFDTFEEALDFANKTYKELK
jgi:hypothetical protein